MKSKALNNKNKQTNKQTKQKARKVNSRKIWAALCSLLFKTLILFMTKICDIYYPIYESKPCFRFALQLYEISYIWTANDDDDDDDDDGDDDDETLI